VTGADIDYAGAYRGVRDRVRTLVTDATDEQLDEITPAAPEWRTRDVLAHLVGVTADVLAGNLEGVTTDAWTAAQVEPRRDRPLADLLAEWDANALQVEPQIASWGAVAGQFVGDAVTHEHDIRGALGRPGARDSGALAIGYEWMGAILGDVRDQAGAGALTVESEAGTHTFGSGEPSARCRTTRFELVRAATGRRSLGQMEAWDWDGDARVELLVIPIFTPRPDPLVE
jgi:uncharacterized protein (TIGR03083 family)